MVHGSVIHPLNPRLAILRPLASSTLSVGDDRPCATTCHRALRCWLDEHDLSVEPSEAVDVVALRSPDEESEKVTGKCQQDASAGCQEEIPDGHRDVTWRQGCRC